MVLIINILVLIISLISINNDSTTNNNGSNSGKYTNNLKDIVYAMECVNLDGKVDGKDQVILSKYLAHESGYDKLPYVK